MMARDRDALLVTPGDHRSPAGIGAPRGAKQDVGERVGLTARVARREQE